MLTADGKSAIAIEQSIFNHLSDLTLQGKTSGLTMKGGSATTKGSAIIQGGNSNGISLTDKAELTLNGDLEVKGGETGIIIDKFSHLSIKSPEKIAISGKTGGLSVGDLCHFSSEGPMILHSVEKGTALSINGSDTFNHQGTLLRATAHYRWYCPWSFIMAAAPPTHGRRSFGIYFTTGS